MMPATVKHIKTNFDRILDLEDTPVENVADKNLLIELANKAAANHQVEGGVDLQAAWAELLEQADAAKVAYMIPGTVGRQYARKYGVTKPRAQRERKVFGTFKLTDAQRNVAMTFVEAFTPGKEPFVVNEGSLRVFSEPQTVRVLERAHRATARLEDKSLAAKTRSSLEALLRKVDPSREDPKDADVEAAASAPADPPAPAPEPDSEAPAPAAV